MSEPHAEHPDRPTSLVRHEEEASVTAEMVPVGVVRARKHVEVESVEEVVPRDIEHADVERVAPNPNDTGEIETLPDGSVSVPILEEELVITKRKVVRERMIIRKRVVTEQHQVEARLRRERVEIETEGDVDLDDASRNGD